ncbi:nodulation protein NfeD [Peribacillus saganii]|uniref:Nodulation protein NfeD n=1 Tax=Peribacillus saganii TaxID=2303992 RepID=A0A372LU07_9BACI|nr:nodulation protein NfeD [Peribacillus saganii]RFU71683.1 nodulation protein NfeD [Peribacillus saganii]
MRKWSVIMFLFLGLGLISFLPQTEAKQQMVYVVPIEDTVEKGLNAFLSRSINTAEEEGADMIIFDVNTPGGAVDAAGKIAKSISETKLHTVAFVNNQALSAGAYISLSADEIYMVPGATMGAAAVIDSAGNAADKKAQSYWLAALKTAAEQNGRDPIYAQAMADESINLPKYGAEKGRLLTFTAEQAEKAGYSEGTVAGRAELYSRLGIENADIRQLDESFAEKLARFITHPVVVPILLTLASIGLVMELYTPGFGLPGLTGMLSLLLFFYGHMVSGLAGYESLLLFVAGVILIILEVFVPGGLVGVLGLAGVVGSLFMASDNVSHMAVSLLIAFAAALILSIILVKVFGRKMKFFKKIILTDSTSTESGYISNRSRVELIGKTGLAATDLRPSGTVIIDDERIDVVTEGSFISKGTTVKVIKTEGSRIVVREAGQLKD